MHPSCQPVDISLPALGFFSHSRETVVGINDVKTSSQGYLTYPTVACRNPLGHALLQLNARLCSPQSYARRKTTMSCRSCRRHLGQFARQARALPVEAAAAPVAASRLSTQARQAQQQKRTLSSSAPCRKSWVPQFVKDAAGQILRSSAQPYQVHAATETIYKTCARQAAYTISETDKRNGTVQKTEDGVEIGTGNTLWHNGERALSLGERPPSPALFS